MNTQATSPTHTLTRELLTFVKAAFENKFTDTKRNLDGVELVSLCEGLENVMYLIERGVFYNGGLRAANQMQTSINNWKYVNTYYLNEQKLEALKNELPTQDGYAFHLILTH